MIGELRRRKDPLLSTPVRKYGDVCAERGGLGCTKRGRGDAGAHRRGRATKQTRARSATARRAGDRSGSRPASARRAGGARRMTRMVTRGPEREYSLSSQLGSPTSKRYRIYE